MGYVHSFESFGTVDGPGIRFVVFLQGCPMRCLYCHNPDTWHMNAGKQYTAEDVAAAAMKYKSYFTGGGGVTVSGGEPMMQAQFVTDIFTILKEHGIHTALDTSGIMFNRLEKGVIDALMAVTNLVLLDIKHIDNEEHVKLTGQPNENVLQFASYLSDIGKDMWIRHVLVPGITDDDKYLRDLSSFLGKLKTVKKVEVLPYHTMGEGKYAQLGIKYALAGVKPPEKERVINAKNILRKQGEN